MLINQSSLGTIFTGWSTLFNKGFSRAPTDWQKVAMKVPSNGRDQEYGWLGQFPKMREWLGDRVVKNLVAHGFRVENRDFEMTISVPRNDILDDRIGIFGPMFEEMGRSAAEFPDELVFDLLKKGFDQNCFDGQTFFDTDYPVGSNGTTGVVQVSNMQAGAGTPWFLLDTSKATKPLLYQERMPLDRLVAKTEATDENVFSRKEYIYGSDGRCNVGYGLWQLAFGSKATLNSTNYGLARAAMQTQRGDEGRLLGIKPDTLVVSPGLEEAAFRLLNTETGAGGESNPWKGTAKLLVSSWVSP